MGLFYFSRSAPPSVGHDRWLTSGVVEADDLETAKAKLGSALRSANNPDDESAFTFADLSITERASSGLIVITMGDRT